MSAHPEFSLRRGHRRFNRLRLGVPAALVLRQGIRSCLIDDISTTGARLRIERPLGVDQTVQLSFHELQIFARVMWARGRECGLAFDTPLDPEDMQGMRWITQNRAHYERIRGARSSNQRS